MAHRYFYLTLIQDDFEGASAEPDPVSLGSFVSTDGFSPMVSPGIRFIIQTNKRIRRKDEITICSHRQKNIKKLPNTCILKIMKIL